MRESCLFLKVSPSSESSLHDATAMRITLSSYHYKHRHTKKFLAQKNWENLNSFADSRCTSEDINSLYGKYIMKLSELLKR